MCRASIPFPLLPCPCSFEALAIAEGVRASRASRATVVVALRAGFGITSEICTDHPLVAVVNGRRTFIAADCARLSHLAASRALRSWRALGAEQSLRLLHAHRQYAEQASEVDGVSLKREIAGAVNMNTVTGIVTPIIVRYVVHE